MVWLAEVTTRSEEPCLRWRWTDVSLVEGRTGVINVARESWCNLEGHGAFWRALTLMMLDGRGLSCAGSLWSEDTEDKRAIMMLVGRGVGWTSSGGVVGRVDGYCVQMIFVTSPWLASRTPISWKRRRHSDGHLEAHFCTKYRVSVFFFLFETKRRRGTAGAEGVRPSGSGVGARVYVNIEKSLETDNVNFYYKNLHYWTSAHITE
jgi:hypothetical protein